MKKIFGLVLCVLLALAFVGCSAQQPAPQASESQAPAATESAAPADDGKMLMGVFMPSADHGFTAESIEQAKGALDKLKEEKEDFDYVLYNTAEASEQANQIATALDMYEFDTIMLWPIDGAPLYNAAQSIKDAGIPLVVYDRLIPDFEPTAEMTGDQIAVGTSSAEYMNEFFADRISAGETIYVLEFQGDTSQAAVERTQSFLDKKDAKIEVVQSFVTMWSRETAFNDMTNLLSNSSKEDIEKISAIYTHDDEPLLGILDAIAQYSGPAKLNIQILIGVGAQKPVLDVMQSSLDNYGINVVTNTYAPGMIRQCVDLASGIMYGSGETGLHLVPVEQITLDNQAEYRKSDEYIYRYGEE
jgi:ribose transport system substrate-binding protein